MKTSLIISTYNRPDALAVTLESILQLNRLPDEVIIGDDGSTSETADVIASFQTRFPVPLIHIWHEDKGFRLAKIRNKCLARATGDYIIQIDGDLIEYNLKPGQKLIVDTGNVAGFEPSVQMDIQTVPGAKNMLFGGEGIFNTVLTGPGRVWLQTMPIYNVANAIRPYIPTGNN